MRRRHRRPDGYDEEGNPFVYLRRVRFPWLHPLARRLIPLGFQLFWRWRLLGWLLCGGVAALFNPWLIPLGIGVFELVILALNLRAGMRVRARSPRNPQWQEDEEDEG
jgi:hypothetical protein